MGIAILMLAIATALWLIDQSIQIAAATPRVSRRPTTWRERLMIALILVGLGGPIVAIAMLLLAIAAGWPGQRCWEVGSCG